MSRTRPWPIDMSTIPTIGTYVYRLLDDAGTVLYVGVTSKPRTRLKVHARTGCIPFTSAWLEGPWADRAAAERMEGALIARLLPPYNVAGVTREPFPRLGVRR